MSSLGRIHSIPGSHFDAGVIDAGDAPAESQKEGKLSDPLIDALSAAHVGDDPEEREERAKLLGARFALLEPTREFLLRARERARAALVEHHEEIKRQCREQQQAVAKLKLKISELGRELDRARELTACAAADSRQAAHARASLSGYAASKESRQADET